MTKLTELTRDLPERSEVVRAGKDGIVEAGLAMNSDDIVLVTLQPTANDRR